MLVVVDGMELSVSCVEMGFVGAFLSKVFLVKE